MKKILILFASAICCANFLFSATPGVLAGGTIYAYSGREFSLSWTSAPSPTPTIITWYKRLSSESSYPSSPFAQSVGFSNPSIVQTGLTQSCYVKGDVVSTGGGYTNEVFVTVLSAFDPGTITTSTTSLCSGTIPSQMTFSKSSSGGNSSFSYQWYSSADNSTWNAISNATTISYTPNAEITSTTYYRCMVNAGAGAVATNTITVFVYPNVSVGAIIGENTICYSSNAGTLSFSTVPSGGTGSGYTYQWQSYTSSWTNISGATSNTYVPGNLYSTQQYRCVVTNSCGNASTNSQTITVLSDLSAGQISANGSMSICENGEAPELQFSTAASGETGSYTYQWQSSPDNTTWSNISGATSTTYSPGTLSATTHYRCNVTGTCGVTKPTNVITLNVIGTYAIPIPTTDAVSKYCKNTDVTITITNQNSKNNWYNKNQEFIQNSGTYTISSIKDSTILYVEAVDANECKSEKAKVNINVDPIKADFYVANTEIEVGDSVIFRFTGMGASSFNWTFNNGFTSTLVEPLTFYNNAGIYAVTLSVASDIGCTNTKTIEKAAVVISKGTISTQELNNENIFIYPMPVSDILKIEYTENSTANAIIYNMSGQVITEQKLDKTNNSIDMSSFPSGSYVLKITSKGKEVYSKTLIKR